MNKIPPPPHCALYASYIVMHFAEPEKIKKVP